MKRINTFADIQIKEIGNPMIVIYSNPSDYPGYFVARVWNLDKPTELLMAKKDIHEIREDIKTNMPTMVRLPRAKNDDPCIVETWF